RLAMRRNFHGGMDGRRVIGRRCAAPFGGAAALECRPTLASERLRGLSFNPSRHGGSIWQVANGLSLPSLQLTPDIIAIEPRSLKHCLVTTEALTKREFDVAFEPRPRRGKMVFAGPLTRSQHSCPRTWRPGPLICEQCLIEIVCVARDRS